MSSKTLASKPPLVRTFTEPNGNKKQVVTFTTTTKNGRFITKTKVTKEYNLLKRQAKGGKTPRKKRS